MSNTKPYCFSRSLTGRKSLKQNGFLVQTVTEEEILAVYESDVPTRKNKTKQNNKMKQKQNKQNHAKKKAKLGFAVLTS